MGWTVARLGAAPGGVGGPVDRTEAPGECEMTARRVQPSCIAIIEHPGSELVECCARTIRCPSHRETLTCFASVHIQTAETLRLPQNMTRCQRVVMQ